MKTLHYLIRVFTNSNGYIDIAGSQVEKISFVKNMVNLMCYLIEADLKLKVCTRNSIYLMFLDKSYSQLFCFASILYIISQLLMPVLFYIQTHVYLCHFTTLTYKYTYTYNNAQTFLSHFFHSCLFMVCAIYSILFYLLGKVLQYQFQILPLEYCRYLNYLFSDISDYYLNFING